MTDSASACTPSSSFCEHGKDKGLEEGNTNELPVEEASQCGVAAAAAVRGKSYTDAEEARMGERRYYGIDELERAMESADRIFEVLDCVGTWSLPLVLNTLVLACRRRLITLSGTTLPHRPNDYSHPFPWESFTNPSFANGRYSTPQRLKDAFASQGKSGMIDTLWDEDLELIYEYELTVREWAMGGRASRGQVELLVMYEKDEDRKVQWVRMVDFATPE
ncbi:hypothetical protein BDN70DRAFT_937564 [Pholiota conissans]|uniref:Uncharacterized protein n=1 Tax=Pholiota conissans TaxID=109636 RepID=A0A9P5YR88_9AGAR|nr:hypothetical protein BDN70DRAFT_937564 [Pholiota conissans]